MARLTGIIDKGGGAFVQLRDAGGDFVGEVRADDHGHFTLYAIPGRWRVICLTPGGRGEQEVDVGVDDVEIRMAAPSTAVPR